eukprot:7499343-Heterocapsa_arctica.AAC.1
MGFTWSLFFAQRVNESRTMRASVLTRTPVNDQSQDAVLRDGGLLHYVYVDNVGVMGTDPMLVNAAMDEVLNLWSPLDFIHTSVVLRRHWSRR